MKRQKSDFPLMKNLARKLNENPVSSRCTYLPECMELVKKRKRPTVFIHVINIAMGNSLKKKFIASINREISPEHLYVYFRGSKLKIT